MQMPTVARVTKVNSLLKPKPTTVKLVTYATPEAKVGSEHALSDIMLEYVEIMIHLLRSQQMLRLKSSTSSFEPDLRRSWQVWWISILEETVVHHGSITIHKIVVLKVNSANKCQAKYLYTSSHGTLSGNFWGMRTFPFWWMLFSSWFRLFGPRAPGEKLIWNRQRAHALTAAWRHKMRPHQSGRQNLAKPWPLRLDLLPWLCQRARCARLLVWRRPRACCLQQTRSSKYGIYWECMKMEQPHLNTTMGHEDKFSLH